MFREDRDNGTPTEDDILDETEYTRDANTKQDVQGIIRAMMASPLKGDVRDIVHLDGRRSISSLKGLSLDVQTRIIMGVLEQALSGDLRAVELLFEYGGYEPPKQQKVALEMPTIVDDMALQPPPETKAVAPAQEPSKVGAPVRKAAIEAPKTAESERCAPSCP